MSQRHSQSFLSRQQGTQPPARLLLITGTPGTGKRAVGSYLEQEFGFVHLDFESPDTRARYLRSGAAALRAAIAGLGEARGLVVTLGATSDAQARQIRRIQSFGFQPIWFDSDRGAACQALFAGDARRASRFQFVDSFDATGRFRPVGAVSTELLDLAPQSRPRPVRQLLAAAGRARTRVAPPAPRALLGALRWRIAAGIALVGAAAVGGGVVLLGGQGGARPAVAVARVGAAVHSRATVAALPRQGVLVDGRSLAGVSLGDTPARVRALWGHNFTKCQGCKPEIWFYFLPTGDPVGAGVEFVGGRVVAVFTLGGPTGWHTQTGIRVGTVLNPFNDPNDPSEWKSCSGYSAKSAPRTGNAVTSILTQGQSVYGFALTRPSVSPCH